MSVILKTGFAGFFIALMWPSFAGAVAYTSSQAGNWSSAATWGGKGVPKNGDTVVIRHPVIVNVSASIGTSGPSGSMAVQCTTPGTLTIATGATFTLRGDFRQENCVIT